MRVVPGDDGREKIQLRIDMGLLQMEIDGRPDGTRPEGAASWLDYYFQKQRAHDAAHPDSASFELSEEDWKIVETDTPAACTEAKVRAAMPGTPISPLPATVTSAWLRMVARAASSAARKAH